MDFSGFTTQALLWLSAFFGVGQMPTDMGEGWVVEQPWTESGTSSSMTASSKQIIKDCQANPTADIVFPAIIHGAHEVRLDGQLVSRFGDPSFNKVRSFYGAPIVDCYSLLEGKVLQWTVFAYSKYFSRFSTFPSVQIRARTVRFFRETLIVVSAGLLIVMSLLSFILFFGKVSSELAWSSAASNLFFAGFYLLSVSEFFGISFNMLNTHKLADTSIFIGVALFFNTLKIRQLIPVPAFYSFLVTIVLTLGIFAFSTSGDQVQFATTLTFPAAIFLMIWSLAEIGRQLHRHGYGRERILQMVSLLFFIVAITNEMLMVLGLIDSYPFLAVGTVGALMFSTLSVNEKIVDAYRERDYLRENLEVEVDRKTLLLRQKSEQLEATLGELKSTQAELVQSAKLASLGTLSAGIAHEINNSLNYVNGALKPLKKMLSRAEPPKDKIEKLIDTMQDGLSLTFKIIDSLRSYSFNNNQNERTDLDLANVTAHVLTILANRLRSNYEVKVDISSQCCVSANETSLNQILLNIVSNALDAMPDGGKIDIIAAKENDKVTLRITDTGQGFPDEIKSRVFEPFFTTKDVGQGTGLGLHIVRQEVLRNGGMIELKDSVHGGAEIVVILDAGNDGNGMESAAA